MKTHSKSWIVLAVWMAALLGPLTRPVSGQITSIEDMRPFPGDPGDWTLQKLLHGWLNTKFTVGAKDVIATNTVTVASLTTPAVGSVIATNAVPFFSVSGGKGMLQSVMICAHTNAPLRLHVFRAYPGVATPGSAYDYDFLNKGHLRVVPPLDFTTWVPLGTSGASGDSYCASVYGLNIPITSTDTALYFILTTGDTAKAQAGWASAGTAPIHITFSGVEDPK